MIILAQPILFYLSSNINMEESHYNLVSNNDNHVYIVDFLHMERELLYLLCAHTVVSSAPQLSFCIQK